ncbi:hypothetical protein [Streptomyces pseudovenezuelae]|uniref:hypothetical protein n=1 Tax=Streptomyces pseudovenezuelae TaxID=67350 RepID=UPI003720F720
MSTINDWLTRKTVPRHSDQVLAVVKVLHRWCGDPSPVERRWHELLERDSDIRSRSEARRPRGDDERPSGAGRDTLPWLGQHISRAFEAEEVELKVFCLTSETLAPHIRLCGERVRGGATAQPRSISLRMLLPADDAFLAYPTNPLDPRDMRPRRRMAAVRHRHTASIRSTLESLRDESRVDVSMEFRAVPVTPTNRIHLLNSDTLLFGYYDVVKTLAEFDDGTYAEIYDALGLHHRVFTRSEPGHAWLVDMTHAWFDALWTSLARPLPER